MKKQVATLSLILMMFGFAFGSPPAPMFTGPTVSDISGLVAMKAYAKTIFLSAISPENCQLTFAIASGPSHGTASLNTATGAVIYTGNTGYTGTDSFTYHATAFTTGSCTTGSTTSSNATVSLTVVDTRTTINGQLLEADGVTPRVGKVQWRLLQQASTFDGAQVTPGSVVERTLDGSGNYTVSLYSTDGMDVHTFWQMTFVAGSFQEDYGKYRIPGSVAALNQAALNALKTTSAQNAAPVSLATTTQVEALAGSVVSGMATAVASATASATAAASSAATSATAASASATSAASAAATAHNYDLIPFVPGVTTPSQLIYKVKSGRALTLPISGSVCDADVAATAQTDFLVKVNGVTKMTLRFAASGTTCTIVSPTLTSISANDVITLVGPATPDLTLSRIAFTVLINQP